MKLSWFWGGYAAAVTLYLAATVAGPAVEAHWFPVRVDQKVDAVERVEDRLCWDWSSEKVRLIASNDMDAYLHDSRQDRMVTSIFGARDGMPWRASGALGLGKHRLRYCVTLPPSVQPEETVRVEMRAWYPGPAGLGLWRFALPIPDVVSPGAPTP